MTTDPVRAALASQRETQRARHDPAYIRALLDGQAPTACAYTAALDMGHEGDAALDAARQIDQAALTFTPPTPEQP